MKAPRNRRVPASGRDFLAHGRVDGTIACLSAVCLACACLFTGASLAVGFVEKQSGSGAMPTDSATGSVTYRNGLLSVDVKNGSWEAMLARIKELTGIRFHCVTPPEGALTASFKELPMTSAREQLFGPEAGFVDRYADAAEAGTPAEVWVLGRIRSVGAGAAVSEPNPNASAPDKVQNGEVRIKPVDTRRLIEMANSSDPAVRLEALSSLAEKNGRDDRDAARSAFDAALTDKDPDIRGLAVQALANRGGDEAMNYLWQGLHDPDPAVRLMAVQTANPKGQGLALLQEALGDLDESVRAIAQFRLEHRGVPDGGR